jgi:signal transduction histidine kinase
MLFKLANAITRPVIELYELIKHIVNHGKGKKMKLSFKYTNDELNNLHKTFNKLATTL